MPQTVLPIFPDGATEISESLSFEKRDGWVTYFHGLLPVFRHEEQDLRSFRMITSQFCATGVTKQIEIIRAFGVTGRSVLRSVKKYREEGPEGFFRSRKTRGATVLTKEVLVDVQQLLDEGCSVKDVAGKLNIKINTLQKAIQGGRLHKALKKNQTHHHYQRQK